MMGWLGEAGVTRLLGLMMVTGRAGELIGDAIVWGGNGTNGVLD